VLEAVGIAALALSRAAGTVGRRGAARRDRARARAPAALVLADEPTGNLDPRNRGANLALLREQIKANAGAGILITHSRTAADTADRDPGARCARARASGDGG
jgi:ABC-type lipoprotein export system ATPase subunit